MIDKASRGIPLGIIFLLISMTLATYTSMNASVILLVHLVASVLTFAHFRRAGRQGNIIEVSLLSVVLLFSIFCAYVLARFEYVVAEPVFEFSVFSYESVKRALLLNDFGMGVMFLVYGLNTRMQEPSKLLSMVTSKLSRGNGINSRVLMSGFYFSWALIVGSVLLTPSVLEFSYPENYSHPWALHPNVRAIMIIFIFALFLVKFVQDKFRTSRVGLALRLTTYSAIVAVGLLGGDRGAAVGLLIGLIALDITQGRDPIQWRGPFVILDCMLAVFAVVNWPYMRYLMAGIGVVPAFVRSFEGYTFLFSMRSGSSGIYLSDFPMLGQSLFHFLYVIALVDSGSSLHYQTFLNLIPQQLPVFLDGTLWVRPVNDNWLLADRFRQNGGFYSFANAYWNGGLLPLGLFAAFIAWATARIEIMFKSLPVYYGAAYFMLILLIPMGFYYGIQGLIRGIEGGLVVGVLVWVVKMLFVKTGKGHLTKRTVHPLICESRKSL